MSRATVISAIRNILDTVHGTTGYAIEGSASNPRPKGPYASVDVLVSTPVNGHETKIVPNGDGFDEQVSQLIECVASVNFYRDGSRDVAEKFTTMLSSNFAIQILKLSSIGMTRVSGIRDLDTIVRGSTERRVQMDVFLNYPSVVSSPIDVIETVEISGVLN